MFVGCVLQETIRGYIALWTLWCDGLDGADLIMFIRRSFRRDKDNGSKGGRYCKVGVPKR